MTPDYKFEHLSGIALEGESEFQASKRIVMELTGLNAELSDMREALFEEFYKEGVDSQTYVIEVRCKDTQSIRQGSRSKDLSGTDIGSLAQDMRTNALSYEAANFVRYARRVLRFSGVY